MTYIILSQFSQGAFDTPSDVEARSEAVSDRIEKECPGLTWKESYSTLGRYDVVDIVEADDPEEVQKAALILRSLGSEHTETLQATAWKAFVDAL